MYYGSGTVERSTLGGRCCICTGRTLRVHSPDGSTFLREMTSWQAFCKCNVTRKPDSSNRCVFYLKNNPPVNTSARSDLKRERFRLLEERRPNNKTKNTRRIRRTRRRTTIAGWVAIWNQFLIQNCYLTSRIAITHWLQPSSLCYSHKT